MKFTIHAQGMFFEIDLSSFLSSINSTKTKIESLGTIKSKKNIENKVDSYNKNILSSEIKIEKRKFSSSMSFTRVSNSRLIERKDGIYLVFSTIDGNNKYSYDFKIMNRISYKTSRKMLFFMSYQIIVDEFPLKLEVMKRLLNNGIRNNYSINKIGFFFNLKLFALFTIIISIFGLGVVNAFGYFGM